MCLFARPTHVNEKGSGKSSDFSLTWRKIRRINDTSLEMINPKLNITQESTYDRLEAIPIHNSPRRRRLRIRIDMGKKGELVGQPAARWDERLRPAHLNPTAAVRYERVPYVILIGVNITPNVECRFLSSLPWRAYRRLNCRNSLLTVPSIRLIRLKILVARILSRAELNDSPLLWKKLLIG